MTKIPIESLRRIWARTYLQSLDKHGKSIRYQRLAPVNGDNRSGVKAFLILGTWPTLDNN